MAKVNGDMVWKVITAIFIPVLFFIGNNVIANDKASRERDHELEEKLNQSVIRQMEQNGETNETLAKILTALEYLKSNGTN